jgi:hypothetical protein
MDPRRSPPPHLRSRSPACSVARAALGAALGLGLAAGAAAACSNHKVSPWPEGGPTSLLGKFATTPDLAAQLENIDVETHDHALTLEREVRIKLPRRGGTVVVRAYVGKDELDRVTHAVRVASAQGVILAIGPLGARDDRASATRLVPALADPESGRAFTSGSDVNGDGLADVILGNDAGGLAVWRLTPNGSTRYEVEMTLPPRRAVDLGLDGVMDLEGWEDDEGTPRGPRLVERAAFDAGRWSSAATAAKSWHARMARALVDEESAQAEPVDGGAPDAAPMARDAGRDGGAATALDGGATALDGGATALDGGATAVTQSVDLRLRRALERAWHRLRAGEARGKVTAELDALTVPANLRAWFERHQRRVLAPQR